MSGQLISGKSSADKVEACENVAGEVLRMLEKLESEGLTPCIPQPPKNWCKDKHFRQDRMDTSSNLKSHGSSIAKPPFVPLQAVRNKNVNMNSGFVKQNSNATPSMGDKTYKSNRSSKPITDCSAPKPMRKKTMRIAANFANEFKAK
ncbi:hypothetical protein AMK59_4012 [Oryctes borbonicus]|uniref:Uncharacterized protein n=1 Tax=Oryctes borbonicus TaxID=1629725 RepID=A0A0T6B6X3_9SCAR|nr:hypothetical protein AMK59_4012 [Oryctes borbonicus]